MIRLPNSVLAELEAINLPWEIVRGSKHYLIKSGTHLLGLCSHSGTEQGRHLKNLIGTIRRNARKIQNGSFVRSPESESAI